MAQVREVKVLDDLSGEEGAQRTEFALDGKEYEIDLSHENRARLGMLLEEFIKAGRRVHPSSSGRRGSGYSAGRTDNNTRDKRTLTREETAEIRTWATANGHKVADRGRIPNSVLVAYAKRDTSKPAPIRDVPYAEARRALKAEGVNTVGKSRDWVATQYMAKHEGTFVAVAEQAKAAG
jgi:hypothetical protein